MKEDQLIKAAKKNDPKALDQLFRESYPIVYGYLLKTTLNEQIARDLTQETFLKALKNLGKFNGRSKFSTWLVSIATNLHKDELRKRKREFPESDNPPLSSATDVEKSVLEREAFGKVSEILKKLPDAKRRVFILKHYYHYSYEEISRIENCPIGTVRSRLHDCINKIRLEMEVEA